MARLVRSMGVRVWFFGHNAVVFAKFVQALQEGLPICFGISSLSISYSLDNVFGI